MAATQISEAKIRKLTTEDLWKLSLEKDKVGCATPAALLAQEELLIRKGHSGIRESNLITRRSLTDEYEEPSERDDDSFVRPKFFDRKR